MAISHPEIAVGNLDIEAADSLTISRSLDTHAGTFSWQSPDFDNPRVEGSPVGSLFAYNPVTIKLDSDVVFTGWTETFTPRSAANLHVVGIGGRSLTADLVDSMAPVIEEDKDSAKTITLGAAIRRVNQGIGTVVYSDDALERITVVDALPATTERVSAYIERLCQQRQLVVTDNAQGDLVILQIRQRPASIDTFEYGDGKMLSAEAHFTLSNAYNEYVVSGYKQIDEAFTDATPSTESYSRDIFPNRTRRLRIAAPQLMDEASAKRWIAHEGERDIAATYAVTITVAGWRNKEGNLYDTGQLYEVNYPHLYTSGAEQLLVGAVTYSHSRQGGQITRLSLSSPKAWIEAFLPLPETPNIGPFDGAKR